MRLTPQAAARFSWRADYLERAAGNLVVDGDVHPTEKETLNPSLRRRLEGDPNYYHGRPLLSDALIPKMEQAKVDMALCWHNPAVLEYGADQAENSDRLAAANSSIGSLAERHPRRVIPGGWTDPKALGAQRAIDLAQRCVEEFAMPVVKMNPAQNRYPISSGEVIEVVDAIVALGAIPAFHFGSDTGFTPADGLQLIARRHPDHPVIGVHMGGGGGHFVEAEATYRAARQLGLDNPNIFFVLSAKREVHIESALITYASAGPPFSGNLAVGSDAPYGDMVWNFGAFRALFAALAQGERYGDPRLQAQPGLFNPSMISGFMGGNLARLVAAADRRILSRCGSAS